MQCPPETSRAVCGNGTSRSARYTLAKWPSRWLTPTTGTPQPSASALAVAMPTSSAPTRPGPDVTATASRSGPATPASSNAFATTAEIVSVWARLASSGTTPPKTACRSIWLATTEERTASVSSTTAAAVSSHDVSMANSSGLTAPAPVSPLSLYLRLSPRHRPGTVPATGSAPTTVTGTAPASTASTSAHAMAPSRSSTGVAPDTLTSVDGTSVSGPPSTIRSDRAAQGLRHVLGPARRRRAVRVGARDEERARLGQQRPQERRGRGCAPPPRSARPAIRAGGRRRPPRTRRRA